ncbi:MAG TPA: nitroreductase family protein [Caproiciproducens sp.]|nr:nitroreductase family protein [Caproiciproducens sp.]
MDMKQDWLKAIEVRTSRRTYNGEPIEPQAAGRLRLLVEDCNAEGGLNIRFVEDGADLFRSLKSGMIRGVPSYFALAAEINLPHRLEKIGYYGELLALECTALGLGTCWISGTYDKSGCQKMIGLRGGEELSGIITVGYVNPEKTLKEKTMSLVSKKRKPVEQWITPSQGLPDWVENGVQAAGKAPSAMNGQPVRFAFENGAVTASVEKPSSYQGMDLGIAMAHFELGAWGAGCPGKWRLENDRYQFSYSK